MRRTTRPRLAAALATALALAVALGCGGPKEDPILRLSAEESLARGKELMEREKYLRARDYLEHAFEVEPNSADGREALLLAADALYLQGGRTHYLQAEAKYRDFQNRFPTSARADYVQYRIAESLLQRMEKPDRDQTMTREAIAAFEDLIALYPTSEYVDDARAKLGEARANLAEHEYQVGHFYTRFRLPKAAVDRFAVLMERYPGYPEMDKVLFHKGVAHKLADQVDLARETFARLEEEYPDSEYLRRLDRERKELAGRERRLAERAAEQEAEAAEEEAGAEPAERRAAADGEPGEEEGG